MDAAANAYVTGSTTSDPSPTTPGAFDTDYNGSFDAFVTKLDMIGAPSTLVLDPPTATNPTGTMHTGDDDGLEDRDERLFGTLLGNLDSDGDGVHDGNDDSDDDGEDDEDEDDDTDDECPNDSDGDGEDDEDEDDDEDDD